MEYFTHELPNGVRCVLQRERVPVCWCALTVDAGSRDENPRQHGAAHFTEHMLFKGTIRRRAHHINNRLEKLGGELNAFTTKEDTTVHATVLRADFAKAAELIADIVFNSTFPAREIEREREVVADEIDSYEDSPGDRIYDQFENMIFAGSSLGHDILGTRASVARFDDKALRDFTARTYNTDRMVFSAVGNISERAFVAAAERYFGDIHSSPRGFARQAPAVAGPFDKTRNRRTHQAHCIVGAHTCSALDNRRTALALLINIIGGPAANSRLSTVLREKNGLTYTAEAVFTPMSDAGLATIYFATEREKIARCRELVNEIVLDLRRNALTGRALAAAKKQYIGQYAIARQSHESAMLAAGKSLLLYGHVEPPDTLYRKIAALAPADILFAANDAFANPSVLVYG